MRKSFLLMRLLWILLILALLVIAPFVLWGDLFDALFSREGTLEWFERFGRGWAWLVGMGLLVADLFLPIPGTVVMATLGYFYGFWLGGLIGAMGSIASGLLAYFLCRWLGRTAAEWIAGKDGLAKGERIFRGEAGGWIVALSRWLPVMPEVVACLAGLSRMPLGRFATALACGSVPLAFAFAAIGTFGRLQPALALVMSAVIPPLLWVALHPVVKRMSRC